MKSVVVYYSLTGNTSLVARMVAERLGADMVMLKPEKEIPDKGFGKYLLGGKSVILQEKPKLLNETFDLDGYDTLVIGTPVWAGSFTPPIHTFLSENMIKDKSVYLFATCSPGSNAEKCFSGMKENLSRSRVKGTAGFEDVKKMSAKELDDRVRRFCKNIMDQDL
jgi:flavodoxin